MNNRFSSLSLRGKLLALGVLPSVLVLFIAATAFAAYDMISYRQALVSDLTGTAHFIAVTSRASLRFGDEDYARRILSGLASYPNVRAAGIYKESGEVFIGYFDEDQPERTLPGLRELRQEDSAENVRIFAPIVLNEEQIGTVYLEADYGRLWQRLGVLFAGLIVTSILLVLAAYSLAARLLGNITRPLNSITRTAEAVSSRKDYSVRAEPQKEHEFAVVTDAFNHMLTQIQSQDGELRNRAAELQRANKELEAFTYTVSHDLRGPLRSISSFSQILVSKFSAALPVEAQDYLRRVAQNAQRMGGLIDDLLAFSHIDAEKLKVEELNLAPIAKDVFDELKAHEPKREVQFQLDTMPKVQADGALLRQVYANLLSNALKYSRPRAVSKIHVGSQADNGKPVFFVRDNGVGFDTRYATNLFRIFQRLHKAEEFEGTGVGLAIVQRIVERHGGKIWAEAELNEGATFYFTLN